MDVLPNSTEYADGDLNSTAPETPIPSRQGGTRFAWGKRGRLVALWGALCAALAAYGAAYHALTPIGDSLGAFVKARERGYTSCLRASAWRSACTANLSRPEDVSAELASAVAGLNGMNPQQAPKALLQETRAAIRAADRVRLSSILLRIDTLRNSHFPPWVAKVRPEDRLDLDLLGAHISNLIGAPIRVREFYCKSVCDPGTRGACGSAALDDLARSEVALSFMQTGEIEKALEVLTPALSRQAPRQDSRRWLPLLARARLYMLEGKYKTAGSYLDVILAAPGSAADASAAAIAPGVFGALLEDAFYEARLLKLVCRVSRDEELRSPDVDLSCVQSYFKDRGECAAVARVGAIRALWALKTERSGSDELAAARQSLLNTVTTLERVGYRDDLAWALDALCQIDQARPSWRSIEHVNRLIVLGETSGNDWAKAQGLHHRSKILVATYGDYSRADRDLKEAVQIMAKAGNDEWVAYSSLKRAEFALAWARRLRKDGQLGRAQERLRVARQAARICETANTKSQEERGNAASAFAHRIDDLYELLAREQHRYGHRS